MSNRSEAAVKANRTRAYRREFEATYPNTAVIAREILQGYETADIAVDNEVSEATVSAVRANLNRDGNFATLANLCNY